MRIEPRIRAGVVVVWILCSVGACASPGGDATEADGSTAGSDTPTEGVELDSATASPGSDGVLEDAAWGLSSGGARCESELQVEGDGLISAHGAVGAGGGLDMVVDGLDERAPLGAASARVVREAEFAPQTYLQVDGRWFHVASEDPVLAFEALVDPLYVLGGLTSMDLEAVGPTAQDGMPQVYELDDARLPLPFDEGVAQVGLTTSDVGHFLALSASFEYRGIPTEMKMSCSGHGLPVITVPTASEPWQGGS